MISLFLSGYFFEKKKIGDINAIIDNTYQKQELISLMLVEIQGLELGYNDFQKVRFQKEFDQIYLRNKLSIQRIANISKTVQFGGKYEYYIKVNESEQDQVLKTINYKNSEECKCYSLAHINALLIQLDSLNNTLQNYGFNYAKNKGPKFEIFTKQAESYFNRLTELGNTVSYNVYTTLSEKRTQSINNINLFLKFKNIILFIVVLLVILYGYKSYKNIKQLLADYESNYQQANILKQAIEESPVSFVLTDPDGNIEYVNTYFTEQTGYTREEAIGQNPRVLKTGILPQSFYKSLWSTIKSGKTWNGEFCNKTKSGLIYWEQAVIAPLKDNNGEIIKFVAVKVNITEKKNLRNSLKETSQSLERIINHLPVGIIILNNKKQVLSINNEASKILQYNNIEEANKHIINNVCHNCITKTEKGKCPIFDLGMKEYSLQERSMKAKNGEISVLKSAIPLKINDEDVLLEAFMDISAQKASRQKEKEANEAKSNFLANMSHELRTPLNGIIGSVEILKNIELTEEQKQIFSIIQTSGENLLSIINDILDFSKIEANKIELELIEFNLLELIEQIIKQFSYKAKEKNIELLYSIGSDVPDVIVSDKAKLNQVLVNLVGNAFKFTKQGEIFINVTLDRILENDYIINFKVEDSGIGIPKDRLESIFEAFSQADSSTTRKYGGTGLGTTISRKFVEKMGGEIKVISPNPNCENQNIGSVFKFFIKAEGFKHKQLEDFRNLPDMAYFTNNRISAEIMHNELKKHQINCKIYRGIKKENIPALSSTHQCVLLDLNFSKEDIYQLIDNIPIQTKVVLFSYLKVTSENLPKQNIKLVMYKPLIYSDLYKNLNWLFEQNIEQKKEVNILQDNILFHLKILVVEDNVFNQKVGQKLLNQLGCTVEIAENGEIAVDLVSKNSYDIVLMDVQMPVMNGLEATELIRSNGNNVPIIAMTANATVKDREICITSGMNNFLTKPIRKDELLKILERYQLKKQSSK
ncbi:MAG: response regulator [Bacteroidales bacterium]|nr:response regulator [Bacteroidales bacterium]